MSKEEKTRYRELNGFYALLLFAGIMTITYFFQQSGMVSIIQFIKSEPLTIAVLVIPILFVLFSTFKGNTREELKKFVSIYLFHYIVKFMSFVMIAYITFFVIINDPLEHWSDFLIVVLLYFSAFIVFLLAKWFDEGKPVKITRKAIKSMGLVLFKSSSLIIVPALVLSLIYYPFFGVQYKTVLAVAGFNSMSIMFGHPSALKRWWSKIIITTVLAILHVFILIVIYAFQTTDMTFNLLIWSSIVGSLLIYTSLGFHLHRKNKINKLIDDWMDVPKKLRSEY